jgi:hypothetical protein
MAQSIMPEITSMGYRLQNPLVEQKLRLLKSILEGCLRSLVSLPHHRT